MVGCVLSQLSLSELGPFQAKNVELLGLYPKRKVIRQTADIATTLFYSGQALQTAAQH